ncbi:phosphopantetheine-binding protein, partial [Streptomyces albulus]|nr:phosphopantetheine-binding protein [Streptomyces noursei]
MVNESTDGPSGGTGENDIPVTGGGESVASLERAFAELLAKVMTRTEPIPADGHFFADLGADSMVMAHFCARVRKRADLPSVSMKDVYQHPTVRSLAAALGADAPVTSAPAPRTAPVPTEAPLPGSTARYVLCGALQLLFFFGYSYVLVLATTRGYQWVSRGSGPWP